MNFEEFETRMKYLTQLKEQYYQAMRGIDDAMMLVWEEYEEKELDEK